MDFCVGTCAKIDQVGLIKQAEDIGVTHFGVGEGPLLFSDPYQQMALASQQTSTIKMGTYVTNPLTRIAPVTANSVATLNALAPGRTFVGPAQVLQNWTAAFEGISDFVSELVSFAIDGENEWGEFYWHGRQADGSLFAMRGVTIMVVRDDRVAEARLYMEPVDPTAEDIDAAVRELFTQPPAAPR